LAIKAIHLAADPLRAIMGPRARHCHVTRSGLRYDLDLYENVQMRIFFDSFDRDEIAALRSYIRPGDTVVDVGAHVGYYALHFADAAGPEGRVVSFEPDPTNLARLRANLELNGFSERVSVVPAIVSEQPGTGKLFLARDTQSGGNSVYEDMAGTAESITCETTTLDAYCTSNGVDHIRVLKIDVEGHEPAVLRGAVALLRDHRIDVVMMEYRASWVAHIEKEPQRFDEPLTTNGYVRVEPKVLPAVDNIFNLIYVSPAATT
jgi:FkbM family methyltransferase